MHSVYNNYESEKFVGRYTGYIKLWNSTNKTGTVEFWHPRIGRLGEAQVDEYSFSSPYTVDKIPTVMGNMRLIFTLYEKTSRKAFRIAMAREAKAYEYGDNSATHREAKTIRDNDYENDQYWDQWGYHNPGYHNAWYTNREPYRAPKKLVLKHKRLLDKQAIELVRRHTDE